MPKPKYLFFDTETTGLLPTCNDPINNALRFPRIVQLSWDFCDVEKDYIIKPDGWVIPEAASRVHGITTAKAKEVGIPIKQALTEFLTDFVRSAKIIAHNAEFDISIIISEITRLYGIAEGTRYQRYFQQAPIVDTMLSTIDFVEATFADGSVGKYPKLEELFHKLFKETFPAHNAIEDVRALKSCYWELVKIKIL